MPESNRNRPRTLSGSVANVSPNSPVVVIEMQGGLIQCVRSNASVRVIVLDSDTEGSDNDLIEIDGEEVVVSDYLLDSEALPGFDGIDSTFVSEIVAEIDRFIA